MSPISVVRGLLLLVPFSLVAVAGCSSDSDGTPSVAEGELPSKAAGALCDAARKCGCEGVTASCEADTSDSFNWGFGAKPGLTYDAQCAGQILGHYTSLSECRGYQDTKLCCRLYYGTKGQGEACEAGSLDDCGKGLRCDGGTCSAICASGSAQLGQPCESARCADGLWCDYSSSGTPVCARLPGAGESCYDSFECAGDLKCVALDADDVCVVPGSLGEACQPYTCGSGLGCIDGVCAKEKAAGTVCSEDDECASGYCDQVCQKPTAEACYFFQ